MPCLHQYRSYHRNRCSVAVPTTVYSVKFCFELIGIAVLSNKINMLQGLTSHEIVTQLGLAYDVLHNSNFCRAAQDEQPKIIPISHRHSNKNVNMSTVDTDVPMARMSVFEIAKLTTVSIGKVIAGQCIYGRYCGGPCKASKYYSRPGGLDGYCYDHDLCLDNPTRIPARTYCSLDGFSGMSCKCEKALASNAWKIYNSGQRCSWWQVWCLETAEVAGAWAVAKAMDQRLYCGSC